MIRDEHCTFIKTSLVNIMKDAVASSALLGDGMEFYAVSGYLLQSLFLKMTGAQEQKMKCICWELATNDLEYRHTRYYQKWSLSECSTLKDKTSVYKDLYSAILEIDNSYNPYPDVSSKTKLIEDVRTSIEAIFQNSNFHKVRYQDFVSFQHIFHNMPPSNLELTGKKIFKEGASSPNADTDIFCIYNLLYRQRNREAHNLQSYQLNLPDLKALRNEKVQKYNNVFLFFGVLLMIDEIFIKMFNHYHEILVFQ